MLVGNGAHDDARVLKAAMAAGSAGYSVHLLATHEAGLPTFEQMAGFRIHRFNARLAALGQGDPVFEETIFPSGDPFPVRRRLFREVRLAGLKLRLWSARLARRPKAAISQIKARRRAIEKEKPPKSFKRHRQYYWGLGEFLAGQSLEQKLADGPVRIVHAHDLYTLPAGLFLAQTTGARLIFDAHEYERGRYNSTAHQRATFAALEDRCLIHTDRVITVSPNIAKLYGGLGRYPAPSVIYNTPRDLDEPDMPGLRARIGLGDDVPLLVFTGRVHGQGRGLDRVVQALQRMQAVHLVILGQRVERYDDWLKEAAEAAGIADRVHLLPPVAPDQVVASIRDADAALCLIQDMAISYRYCLPNKLFEAAFAGVPLVVSDLPELKAFVDEIGNGVAVDQTDPESIANGIRLVLKDRAAFTPAGSALTRLHEEYSWPAQKRRIANLYEELIQESDKAQGQP